MKIIFNLLYIFIFIAVILTVSYLLMIEAYNLIILSLYIILPLVLSIIIFVIFKNIKKENIMLNKKNMLRITFIWFLLFNISLLLLIFYKVRPTIYFIIISFMFLILFIQAIYNKKSKLWLFQAILLMLNLIWGINSKYYLYIGRTDLLGHSWFIKSINDNYRITKDLGIYQSFPLWHILNHDFMEITNNSFSITESMFLLNGLIYIFIIISIYIFSRSIFKKYDYKIIPLIIIILPGFYNYGLSSIARSVIPIFQILMFFLFFQNRSGKNTILILLFSISIIVYHTASMPFVLFMLIAYFLFDRILLKNKNNNYNYILLLIMFIIMIGYWIYFSNILFETLVVSVYFPTTNVVITKSIITDPLNEVINYLHYSILLLLMFIGYLIYAYKELYKSKRYTSLFILPVIAIILSFPGPVLLLSKLSSTFNIMRFEEYTYLFIPIPVLIAMYHFKYKKYFKYVLSIIIIMLCFFSVTNDFVASDNPLVKRPFYTYYLSEQEIVGVKTLTEINDNNTIISDYVIFRYIYYSDSRDNAGMLQVHSDKILISDNSTIIFRLKESKRRPLKVLESDVDIYEKNKDWEDGSLISYLNIKNENFIEFNKIYSNGNIHGYQNKNF